VGLERATVEGFLHTEARLMDEYRYPEWEELWTDDGIYWVPLGEDADYDPTKRVSLIYDDRELIAARVRRLTGNFDFAQQPKSHLCRLIANIEVEDGDEQGSVVRSRFHLVEYRRSKQHFWAGNLEHHLVRNEDGDLRMRFKKVLLTNRHESLPNCSFLF
jgi:benzoate/toluate 1,2-dioxygenase subunit beta